MKWFRYSFAAILLFLCLPTWRLIDWAIFTLPFPSIFIALMGVWSLFFVFIPLKLLIPKMHPAFGLLIVAMFIALPWGLGSFSGQATLEPEESHCSAASYTGFFYPARKLLSNAHQDDLEVRNQICWVMKLINKVPEKLNDVELAAHLDLLKHRLEKPHIKYRVALPWIMFMIGKYMSADEGKKTAVGKVTSSREFFDQLQYWSMQYEEEISIREYAWYEWPHSSYIKFEYGIIEKNWNDIHIEFNN